MNNLNKRAISEVIEVLNHTDKDIIEKIPEKFIKLLHDNADPDYKPSIDFYNVNWENMIEDDAKAILALIYRDYIVSESERNKLIEEEQQMLKNQEAELREKYNPDNIFKNRTHKESSKPNNAIENMQLTEVKQAPWYKRLLDKILSFFAKK